MESVQQVAVFIIALGFLFVAWQTAVWDSHRWQCVVTPFAVAMVPFGVVAVITILVAPLFGFVQVSPAIFLVWSAGGGVLLLSSLVARKLIPASSPHFGPQGRLDLDSVIVLARVTAAFAGVVSIVKMIWLLGNLGALAALADEQTQQEFGGGVAGHIQAFAYPAVAILVARGARMRVLDVLCVALGALGGIVYQVKYTLLMPITAGAILGILSGNIRLSVRIVCYWIAGGIALFMVVYLLGFALLRSDAIVSEDTYLFLGRHVVAYLTAGILSLSEALRAGSQQFLGATGTMTLPFQNLFAVLVGEHVVGLDDAVRFTFQISQDGTRENVFTLFGVLYLYLGACGMMAYTFILGLVAYAILSISRRSRSPWIACAAALLLAFLSFGWFHFFFWLLTPIEVVVVTFTLAALWEVGNALRMWFASLPQPRLHQ